MCRNWNDLQREKRVEEIGTWSVIYIYKEECLSVCLFVCLFVRYAFSPYNSQRHQTFHDTSLGPGEGRHGVGVGEGVNWVRVWVWGETMGNFTQIKIKCNLRPFAAGEFAKVAAGRLSAHLQQITRSHLYIYKEESAFGCLFAIHSVPVIGTVTKLSMTLP